MCHGGTCPVWLYASSCVFAFPPHSFVLAMCFTSPLLFVLRAFGFLHPVKRRATIARLPARGLTLALVAGIAALTGGAQPVRAQTAPSPRHPQENAPGFLLARVSTPALERSVTLRAEEVSLGSILRRVGRQADVSVAFDADLASLHRRVSLDVEDKPAWEVFRRLFEAWGLQGRITPSGHLLVGPRQSQPAAPTGILEGRVIDAETGQTLPGVNVQVVGTDFGAATGADGRYRIAGVEEGVYTMRASFVGYGDETQQGVEVHSETVTEIDFVLQREATGLDEVVVTALGLERETRSLGYSMQKVEGEDLARVRETNVVNSLAGEIAGVRITNSSGGVGASSRITIRGENTIGNNQPLFVIDGIPIDNSNLKSGTGNFETDAGGSDMAVDFGNAVADVNPDDIESINVLKGPSAAALYGSRAANGVVLIETKSGRSRNGIGVTFNSSYTAQSILELPTYQNEYGQGARDQFEFIDGDNGDGGDDISFGPPLDEGLAFVQFNSEGEPAPWVSHPDNVRNFFRTGQTAINNIALTGGSESIRYRASYTNLQQSGIVPNTDLGRHTLALKTSVNLTEALSGQVAANYVRTDSDNRMGGGYDDQNVMKQFTWFGRQVDVEALRQYAEGNEANWNTKYNENPWFTVRYNTNGLERDRLFGKASLSYAFTDWLNLKAQAGLDRYTETRDIRRAENGYEFPNGAYTRENFDINELNTDFLLTFDRPLTEDFSLELSAGGNRMRRSHERDLARARALAVPNVFNMSNARGTPVTQNRLEDKQINSLYALGELSFRDQLYLSATGRNDWSSTLPADNNSYFYPSVSVSAIVTDLLGVESTSPLSFAKVRGSWSQVGSDTDPYQLRLSYDNSVANWGSATTVSVPSTLPNAHLEPEITTSYEVGTDLELLQGRLGIGLTYYDSRTENQILRSAIATETGFSTQVFNAGEIANAGVEVTLHATPFDRQNGFGWEVSANYSRNRNEVVELADNVDQLLLPGSGLLRLDVVAREGEPYGTFVGREMRRTPDGEVIYGADGLPELTDEARVQGNYQPDWRGALANTFSYKNLRLDVLIDGQIGGDIYSGTNVIGRRAGTLASTLEGREEGLVGDGVVENPDGSYSPNTTRVSAQDWYLNYYGYHNTEVSVFDASYIKLRELTLSYTLPRSFTGRLSARSVTLSAIGRNLAILHKNVPNIDPETSMASDIVQGIEFGQIPSTRTYGLKIGLSF